MTVRIVLIRSGQGEAVRAELLGSEGDRLHVRFLREVQGRTPESWIHSKRLLGDAPDVASAG